MFQSSRMSWSSKIIVLGSVESSHRFGGVAPGQRVEVGVLLEVLQLLARRLVDVTPGGDELLHLGGGLVGVHLVAEEDDHVRPRQLLAGVGDPRHRQCVGPHRVDAVGAVALAVVLDAGPARAEREARRLADLQRADHRGRQVQLARVRGPHGAAAAVGTQRHGVRRDRARLEPVDLDQRVVVAVHGERRRRPAAVLDRDGDQVGVRGLHPDRRGRRGRRTGPADPGRVRSRVRHPGRP